MKTSNAQILKQSQLTPDKCPNYHIGTDAQYCSDRILYAPIEKG